MIFPEQAEYATFANEMLKSQTRKPDYKVAEVILTRIFKFCPKIMRHFCPINQKILFELYESIQDVLSCFHF